MHWTSVDPEGATQIDTALVNYHGHADMSESGNKARVDADTRRLAGTNAVVSVVGNAER